MDPHPARLPPPLRERGERDPHEVGGRVRVQPRVVAPRLDEPDVRARDQRRRARQLDGHDLVGRREGGGRRRAPGEHPGQGQVEPFRPQRLEQVVHRADLVRVDRLVVVVGHERHRRRGRQRRDDAGQLHARHVRHADVGEHRVRRGIGMQEPERDGRVGGREHRGDAGMLAQQLGQRRQRGLLVVDGHNDDAARTAFVRSVHIATNDRRPDGRRPFSPGPRRRRSTPVRRYFAPGQAGTRPDGGAVHPSGL